MEANLDGNTWYIYTEIVRCLKLFMSCVTPFRWTDQPPGVILSCVLADFDLCVATSMKVTTSLVKVTMARQLDGHFTETLFEAVSEALVSLRPVENLQEAVVGLSHTTVHVW